MLVQNSTPSNTNLALGGYLLNSLPGSVKTIVVRSVWVGPVTLIVDAFQH